MKVLMVLTSHDKLGNTGRKTGFWLEADITIASPKGGQPPLDPKSNEPGFQTRDTRRFDQDSEAQAALANTAKLSQVSPGDYDAVFYPGGHGPLWDLAEDRNSISFIERTYAAGKPVALVCHAPGVLRHVKGTDGKPLANGKAVTGFTNSEEAAVGLTDIVPFLVEDVLEQIGGTFSAGNDWESHVVQDGQLITGQNPASSAEAARLLIEAVNKTAR
jgi:putative intracellular protease/amidase